MALHWFRKGLAALGLVVAGGTAAAAPTAMPASPRPALWKVVDKDTTVYLFGTIHLLPKGYKWRSATFDQAAQQSQGLIVETIIDTKNPAALAGTMMRLGISPGLPPVEQRVPPAKRSLLREAMAKSGLPAAALNRLETWAVAFTLLGTQFRSMDLHQDAGVETILKSSFSAAGKPIGQLETNDQQLGFFDSLPESAQRSLLEGAIERPTEVKQQFDAMLAAWARGDVEAIARTFNSEMADSPALKAALLQRRNTNWARWIEQRMTQPGSLMVAVGAGHLAGPDSVQTLLRQRGFKVTRVQ